jgi:hypothetical protein
MERELVIATAFRAVKIPSMRSDPRKVRKVSDRKFSLNAMKWNCESE